MDEGLLADLRPQISRQSEEDRMSLLRSICGRCMIADAQAVEHYEIARYGTLIAWAKQLGLNDAAGLLHQTLEQEYSADKKLTQLAEERLNREAA